jgi:hypothetical protein
MKLLRKSLINETAMKSSKLLLRHFVTTVALTTLWANVAEAVLVTHSAGTPAPNLPGYTSYTFTVNLSAGESLTSFDAFFLADEMSQVNPMGQFTVWEDNNDDFPVGSLTPADDSQFEFMTSEWGFIISQQEGTGPPPPLQGRLVGSASTGLMPGLAKTTTFDLAHVVVKNTSPTLTWIVNTQVNNVLNPASGVISVPEASQVLIGILASIGAIGVCAITRRRQMKSIDHGVQIC